MLSGIPGNAASSYVRYLTLQEAVMAWHRLRPEQTKRATIKVFGGPIYTASEIVRLHFGGISGEERGERLH